MSRRNLMSFQTKTDTLTDKFGIVWSQRYSIWTANVGKIVPVQVAWQSDGTWKITVGTATLKPNAASDEEGRARALNFIKHQTAMLHTEDPK